MFSCAFADGVLASSGHVLAASDWKIVEAPIRRHVGTMRRQDVLAIRDAFARGEVCISGASDGGTSVGGPTAES